MGRKKGWGPDYIDPEKFVAGMKAAEQPAKDPLYYDVRKRELVATFKDLDHEYTLGGLREFMRLIADYPDTATLSIHQSITVISPDEIRG